MTKLPFPSCPFVTVFTDLTARCSLKQDSFIWKTGNEALLIFHESASITYSLNGEEYHADPGSVMFLPPESTCDGNIRIGGSVIRIGYQSESAAKSPERPMLLTTFAPRHLRDRFLHFAHSLEAATEGHEIAMLADFYGILYDLNRNTDEGNRRMLQQDKIRPSVAYLEKHDTDRRLSMKQVAALSGVSETYFRTLFEKLYGCTPLQFVNGRRLRRAAALLTDTTMSVEEIREACGFGDSAHFVRSFRKLMGLSPEEYRLSRK